MVWSGGVGGWRSRGSVRLASSIDLYVSFRFLYIRIRAVGAIRVLGGACWGVGGGGTPDDGNDYDGL